MYATVNNRQELLAYTSIFCPLQCVYSLLCVKLYFSKLKWSTRPDCLLHAFVLHKIMKKCIANCSVPVRKNPLEGDYPTIPFPNGYRSLTSTKCMAKAFNDHLYEKWPKGM